MAILVAGGAGYIGSVTVELLRAAGERVVVLDNLVRGHRPSLDADIPFYQGKIGDRALLQRIAAEHQLESCIHFAAVTYVGESVKNPAWYYENNVEQGIALMSALARRRSAPRGLLLHCRHLRRCSARPHLRKTNRSGP